MCTLCSYNPVCSLDGTHKAVADTDVSIPVGLDLAPQDVTFIPDDVTTTATISVGQTVYETLSPNGDQDWFRITLSAGQQVTIDLEGFDHAGSSLGELVDPYVRVYSSTGGFLGGNDDGGPGLDSRMNFTATSGGTYYIEAASYANFYAGDYALTVSGYTPPAAASLQTLADFLTDGYWSTPRQWNLGTTGTNAKNGVLTYTVSSNVNDSNGLEPARANLVREAYKYYEAVLGIDFQEVYTQTADFVYQDNDGGAYAGANTDPVPGQPYNYIDDTFINIDDGWQNGESTIGGYTFQTILHEIGHAIGLGHQGPYNGFASYSNDAAFTNDSWQASMMSYFDQDENTTTSASRAFLITPMAADFVAMSDLYAQYGFGTNNAFTGDTVYGFNTNITTATSAVLASLSSYAADAAFTIIDGGGTDTLDFSGYGSNQRIDLTVTERGDSKATTSNIGNEIENMTLAAGTVIENAIAGNGNDTLIGNAYANSLVGNGGIDTIDGGAGNDIIVGGALADVLTGGADNDLFVMEVGGAADRILDFSVGEDLLQVDGGAIGDFSGTLINGGTDLEIMAPSDPASGIPSYVVAVLEGVLNLNSGDEDVLLHANGDRATLNQLLGVAPTPLPEPPPGPGPSVVVNETAQDYNRDGSAEILWFNTATNSTLIYSGMPGPVDFTYLGIAGAGFEVGTSGDFSGDGTTDILWVNHQTQTVGYYEMDSGTPVWRSSTYKAGDYVVAGAADLTGDGVDEIIWTHNGINQIGYMDVSQGDPVWNNLGIGGSGYRVAGTGDFNGDGVDNVLWYNLINRNFGYWNENGNGSFDFILLDGGGANWQVAGVGDFNDDDIDDILWHNTESDAVGYHEVYGNTVVWNNMGIAGPDYEVKAVADYSGDGIDDILWYNTQNRNTGYYEMDTGTPVWRFLGVSGENWEVVGTEPAELVG